MRKLVDIKYFKISLYMILVVACSILIYRVSSSTDNFIPQVLLRLSELKGIFSSVAVGFIIAYLMNPSMNFFERQFCKILKPKTPKRSKKIRRISIALVYLILFGAIYLFIMFLGPQLAENIKVVILNLQANITTITTFLNNAESYIYENMTIFPTDAVEKTFNAININTIFDVSLSWINAISSTLITSALNLTSLLLDAIISFMVAMYILTQKETFANGSKRFVYALFSREKAKKILEITNEAHFMMIRFFVGKSLDSLIIGFICFVGLTLMKNPYALLLSLIVGVFNMIPYFGPFIGAIPSVLITLFVGWIPALMVAVFILILQQFDGLYLGPKILGDSLGITPFWIIASVTIGGKIVYHVSIVL